MNTLFFVAKTEANEKIYCSECEEVIWQCDDVYLGFPQYASLWYWATDKNDLLERVERNHIHEKDRILPLGLE